VISFLSLDLLRDARSTTTTDKVFQKYTDLEERLYNQSIQRQWFRLKNRSIEKITSHNKNPRTKRNRKHPRLQKPPLPISQWNLLPFLTQPTDPLLRATTLSLFYSLYPNIFHDPSNLLERLLQTLIESFSQKKAETLTDLYPKEKDLATLYYTLLRGTNAYDVTVGKGIPPLGDFVCLREGKPAYFRYSSPILLQAIFGQETKEKIMKEERMRSQALEKTHILSRRELESFPELRHQTHLFSLFSFDTVKSKTKEIEQRDDPMGLCMRKRLRN
jgi:hypothetical protein